MLRYAIVLAVVLAVWLALRARRDPRSRHPKLAWARWAALAIQIAVAGTFLATRFATEMTAELLGKDTAELELLTFRIVATGVLAWLGVEIARLMMMVKLPRDPE